jgi:hypothetical protein
MVMIIIITAITSAKGATIAPATTTIIIIISSSSRNSSNSSTTTTTSNTGVAANACDYRGPLDYHGYDSAVASIAAQMRSAHFVGPVRSLSCAPQSQQATTMGLWRRGIRA